MEDFNERIVSGGEMDIDNWQYSLRLRNYKNI